MSWWRLLMDLLTLAVKGDRADDAARKRREKEAASAEAEARRAREIADRLEGRK